MFLVPGTEKGLIYASSQEFGKKLDVLEKRCQDLENKNGMRTPRVFQWFRLHVFPVIRDNMNTELLKSLGIKSEKYTQNSSESVNAIIKRYVNFKKQDIFSFVNDLEECILEQQNEMGKAVLGLGRWKLASLYESMQVPSDTWFGPMSSDARADAVETLQKAPSLCTVSLSPCSHALTSSVYTLSMPYTSLSGFLSDGELESLWAKSARLIREKRVVSAPGSTDSV